MEIDTCTNSLQDRWSDFVASRPALPIPPSTYHHWKSHFRDWWRHARYFVQLPRFDQESTNRPFRVTLGQILDDPILISAIVALLMIVVILKIVRPTNRNSQVKKQQNLPWVNAKESTATAAGIRPLRNNSGSGMEVWRTSRERSSTFDFFGMHTTRTRTRTNSSGRMELIRQQSGSADYSIRENPSLLTSSNNIPNKKGSVGSLSRGRLNSMEYLVKNDGSVSLGGMGRYTHEPDGYYFDEFGVITLSFQVEYFGPAHTSLQYSTWTPPTSWSEASRRILPQDIMLKLSREIILNVAKAAIIIQEPDSSKNSNRPNGWDFALDVFSLSTHVIPPVEGGVMNLYIKESSKEEWMEYTFETAQMAAQFQLDLLAYQSFGKTLYHMYQALSLVHQGSIAHDGQEFVLHDDREESRGIKEVDGNEDNFNTTNCVTMSCGVAWDDAMRSLSSIPSVRIALERLWLHHRNQGFAPTAGTAESSRSKKTAVSSSASATSTPHSTDKANADGPQISLTEEYANKRLLLGPVDFFRLFVPVLPLTAVPQNESDKARVEQLLRWRKRAARAAVLVRTYTLSHKVVNQGWGLSLPMPSDIQPLTRRLAYDGNDDNNRRDVKAKNEYYEGTVSRDVLCHVRPFDYFSSAAPGDGFFSPRKSVLSPCQAYSLVGAHIFQLPDNDAADHPLHHSKDPVASLPSLHDLISCHPDLDFFVAAFYSKTRNVAVVCCFVRSLPKGVDPQFDNVVSLTKKSFSWFLIELTFGSSTFRRVISWTGIRMDPKQFEIENFISCCSSVHI